MVMNDQSFGHISFLSFVRTSSELSTRCKELRLRHKGNTDPPSKPLEPTNSTETTTMADNQEPNPSSTNPIDLRTALANFGIPLERQDELHRIMHNSTSPNSTQEMLSRATRNDDIRTLNAVLKPQKPSPYLGQVDALECLNFLANQEEYFQIVELHPNSWVKYTSVSLQGEAKSWWRDSGLTLSSTWEEFKSAFTVQFTPPNSRAAARQELERLNQGKRDDTAYTAEFRPRLRPLPTIDHETSLHRYLEEGLEENKAMHTKLMIPETLEAAIKLANITDGILYSLDPKTPAPKVGTRSLFSQQLTTEPMDVNKLRLLFANLATLANLSSLINSTELFDMRQPLRKLTDTERERLRRIGACFRCRRTGHRASQCRASRINVERKHQGDL
ncbi:hypothetical protein EDD11_004522 [Mortierella claussenii]|nr:hypothetical protein EDD11_004522 [Mortierella claussenii]